MGSTLRKALGYGLNDVTTKFDEIHDSRINSDSILVNEDKFYDRFNTKEEAHESYLKFLIEYKKQNPNLSYGLDFSLLTSIGHENFSYHDVITHSAEEGSMENVLVVTPLSGIVYGNWLRRDDTMDCIEASFDENPYDPKLKMLESGIYPYFNSMDAATGITLNSYVSEWERAYKKGDTLYADKFALKLGFTSSEEASKKVAPDLPHDVRTICEWGELFINPIDMYQLRPLFYSYFS